MLWRKKIHKSSAKIIQNHKKSSKICLVVSTPLKNISQLGLLFPIYGKSPNWMESQFMFQTTNQIKLLMKSPNHSIPMVPYRHSASSRSFPPGTSPSQCLCRVPSAARRCPRSFQVRQKVLPWRGDGTGVYSFLYASVHLFFVIQK